MSFLNYIYIVNKIIKWKIKYKNVMAPGTEWEMEKEMDMGVEVKMEVGMQLVMEMDMGLGMGPEMDPEMVMGTGEVIIMKITR
jgi:hypothetical protein